MTTPSSVAIPKCARKPTKTAVDILMGEHWKSWRTLCPNKLKSRNSGRPESHSSRNSPDQATATPEKTFNVELTERLSR